MNAKDLGDNADAAKDQADSLPGALAIGIIGAIFGSLVALRYMLALRQKVIDTSENPDAKIAPSPCPCCAAAKVVPADPAGK